MAIFHLSVKTFSRSKGQSATASVAYRAGAKIECEREGRTHDYTKKNDIIHSEIFLPASAPSWANDRQQLWNEVEKAEKRKNSTVAREFEVALPYELNEEQRIALVRDFAKQIVERHGCAVDAHLHDDSRTAKANHHAHIMLTTRKLEQDGFTDKTRELDQKRSGEVVYWREQWANTVNKHLWEYGIERQVDHRSLKEQGLERQPTIKMGIHASALERQGIKTNKGDYNRAVSAYDPDKINKHLTTQFKQAQELHNKLNYIRRRLPEVKRDVADKQPKLYQAFDDMGIPTAPSEMIIEKEQSEKIIDRPTSARMAGQTNLSSSTNEREREISTVGEQEADKLGQGHTREIRRSDSQAKRSETSVELSGTDEIEEKRQQVQLFLALCDEQAENYHKHKLSKLRDKGKPLLNQINNLKDNKPLNPFKIKAWKESLDKKIKQYENIKAIHDEMKNKGVTAEDEQHVYVTASKKNPEAYVNIQTMSKEISIYDEKQEQLKEKRQPQRVRQYNKEIDR